MKRLTLALVLASVVFSLGVLADETMRPDGAWWQKIGDARRLGYVEGYVAGHGDTFMSSFCEHATNPKIQGFSVCVLYRLQQDTMIDTDTTEVLDTMSKFYALPQNNPVRWNHAVIISRAMVSGVSVSEKDLQVIREDDAKFNAGTTTK